RCGTLDDVDLVLHLRGFVAVADELSVSEAAWLLGVDQPLLSRRLRALERELGVELIDRSRRQIALTADGAALLPRARHLVEQADHLVRTVRHTTAPTVRLAVPPECDPAVLAELTTTLADAALPLELTEPTGGEPHPDGSWTVETCDPASAQWTVPLGAGSATGGHHAVRLSGLRPRRGEPARPLLVLPPDLTPPRDEWLASAVDAAGLSPALVRPSPVHVAVSEALAGRATVLCTAREAREHELVWTPVTDPPLLRGYRLAEREPLPQALATGSVRSRALELIGTALGAGDPGTTNPDTTNSGTDRGTTDRGTGDDPAAGRKPGATSPAEDHT